MEQLPEEHTQFDEMNWRDAAACASDGYPDLFYPDKSDKESVLRAKKICQACPVIQSCLREALQNGEEYGIWGGLTEYERDRLKGRARRNALLAQ